MSIGASPRKMRFFMVSSLGPFSLFADPVPLWGVEI
jgi:hypothetical protein